MALALSVVLYFIKSDFRVNFVPIISEDGKFNAYLVAFRRNWLIYRLYLFFLVYVFFCHWDLIVTRGRKINVLLANNNGFAS